MATFDDKGMNDPNIAPVPDFSRASEGYTSGKSFAGRALSDMAGTLDAGIKAIDRGVERMIYDDMESRVETIRTAFGNDDRVATMTSALGSESLKNTPPDVLRASKRLTALQKAAARGSLNESHYDTILLKEVKDLKRRNPGYTPEIDEMVKRLTGRDPANSLINNLFEEGRRAAASANDSANKDESFVDWMIKNNPSVASAWRAEGSLDVDKLRMMHMNDQAPLAEIKKADAILSYKIKNKEFDNTLAKENTDRRVAWVIKRELSSMTGPYDNFQKKRETFLADMADDGRVSASNQQELTLALAQLEGKLMNSVQLELANDPNIHMNQEAHKSGIELAKTIVNNFRTGVTNKDIDLFETNMSFIEAKQNEYTAKHIDNNPEYLPSVANRKLLGDNWITPENTSMYVDVTAKAVQEQQALKLARGETKAMIEGLKNMRSAGVKEPLAYQDYVTKLTGSVVDPTTPKGTKLQLMEGIFGPANHSFISQIARKDQAQTLATMASPKVYKEVKALSESESNPELLSNYHKFLTRSIIDSNPNLGANLGAIAAKKDLYELKINSSTHALEIVNKIKPGSTSFIGGLTESFSQSGYEEDRRTFNRSMQTLMPIWKDRGMTEKQINANITAILHGFGVMIGEKNEPATE